MDTRSPPAITLKTNLHAGQEVKLRVEVGLRQTT